MKFEKFTPREKQIYKKGKIVAYYQARRKKKKTVRYGKFDVDSAFQKALERTYGKDIDK